MRGALAHHNALLGLRGPVKSLETFELERCDGYKFKGLKVVRTFKKSFFCISLKYDVLKVLFENFM